MFRIHECPARFVRLTVLAVPLLAVACGGSTAPENPTPSIEMISPSEVARGTQSLVLAVQGSGFVRSSVVRFNGQDRPTQFMSESEVRAALEAADFAEVGPAEISVSNPAPGGGTSGTAQLVVRDGDNPEPEITSISPGHLTAGTGATPLMIEGTGFIEQSRVIIGFADKDVVYHSETELQIEFSEEELAEGGTLSFVVANPPPGGGISNEVDLEIRSPTPVLSSLDETETTAGQAEFRLRARGDGFISNSEVLVDGEPRVTKFVSPQVLETVLGEEDLRAAGEIALAVRNPAPGGGASEALTFRVVNGVPEITLLPSRGASAGRSGFELMVHGRGFVESSVIRWNGSDRPTRYIRGDRLAATISSGDVSATGSFDISVHTPSPGGGTSSSVPFRVAVVGSATLTGSRTVELGARDLVFDSATERLYASVPGGASPYANSIVAIDPGDGSISGSVFVGSEPDRLARSDDGVYLYVGLNGASAVRRLELATLTPGLQWSLSNGEVAGDIDVAPGQRDVVAVSRHTPGISPSLTGVTIYDAGVARPISSDGHTGGSRIEFLESPSVLYGFNNLHTGFEFFTIAVDLDGARHVHQTGGLFYGFATDIAGASGRMYGTDGSVVDAGRRVKLGTLANTGSAVTADPVTGRIFMATGSGIQVFDMNTYQLLGTLDVPAAATPVLVRWGEDGLAFLDEENVYLIRSPIVSS